MFVIHYEFIVDVILPFERFSIKVLSSVVYALLSSSAVLASHGTSMNYDL